jgi:hypothetical protein
MTKNTNHTDQAITLDVLAERLAGATSQEDRRNVIDDGLKFLAELEAGTGIATMRAWVTMGTAADAVAREARGTASTAKVTQAEAHAALAAVRPDDLPTKQAVGRWLRASRILSGTLADCQDAYGQDDGPVTLSRAIDILTWCEAKQGTTGTTNRGTATATKAQAEAEAEARAKASAEAEEAKTARRATMAKAKATKVYGLVTAKAIREADDATLAATIVACQDALAMRQAEAEAKTKAENQAKREATKATKAEAAATAAEAKAILAEAKAEAERLVAEAKAAAAALKASA